MKTLLLRILLWLGWWELAALTAAPDKDKQASSFELELQGLREQLAAVLAAYHALEDASPQKWPQTLKVKALQAQISNHITQGADPCPRCDSQPHGIQHPAVRGKHPTMYEVGCPVCYNFEHTDGSIRRAGVREHFVSRERVIEWWNEGPDSWTIVELPKEKP